MGKKSEQTYEKILDASLSSLSKYGDRGTTFQTIADLAGVSQPLVSKYFKTREAVLPIVIEKYLSTAGWYIQNIHSKLSCPFGNRTRIAGIIRSRRWRRSLIGAISAI